MLSISKRVDPRAVRTRGLLIEAFKAVLLQKSFEEITIQDIAAQATVNRATFYAHFTDKYALAESLIRDDFAALLAHRLQPRPDTPSAYLRAVFLAVTDHWGRHGSKCQTSFNYFESLTEAQIKAQVRDDIQAWLLEKHTNQVHSRVGPVPPKPAESIALAATLLSWAIYGAAVEWNTQAPAQSPNTFADAALPLLIAMVTSLEA